MSILLQIMNHMLSNLEYSVVDVDCAFTDIENGDESLSDLCYGIGFDPTPSQLKMAEKSIKNWKSALHATAMKLNLN